jgi:hypothetical protein
MNTASNRMPSESDPADFPPPAWAKKTLLAAVFVGNVVGMLIFGYAGDVLGVSKGLVLTTATSFLG